MNVHKSSVRQLARVLETPTGKNDDRSDALRAHLSGRLGGDGFVAQTFMGPDGACDNFWVDVGRGSKVLLLIAHHDAVTGSPGGNDNGAAVGILLHLLETLKVPTGMRVRLLFTGEEERELLGAKAYVDMHGTKGVIGALSLELCGIGDQLVVWDAAESTPFRERVIRAAHAVPFGSVPGFTSDHRMFVQKGVPAYGLSVVPTLNMNALTEFISSRGRSSTRPAPFDTYHTARDTFDTLESYALVHTAQSLSDLVQQLDQ